MNPRELKRRKGKGHRTGKGMRMMPISQSKATKKTKAPKKSKKGKSKAPKRQKRRRACRFKVAENDARAETLADSAQAVYLDAQDSTTEA
jgi:hypothetical protein